MQLPVPPQPAAYFAQRPLKGNTQKSRLKTVENGVTLPELQGWLEPSGDPDSVCLRKLAADMGQGGGRTVQDPSFSFPGSSALGRGLCLAPVRVPRLRGDGCMCIRIQSIRSTIHCNPITPPLPLPQKPSLDADSTAQAPFPLRGGTRRLQQREFYGPDGRPRTQEMRSVWQRVQVHHANIHPPVPLGDRTPTSWLHCRSFPATLTVGYGRET